MKGFTFVCGRFAALREIVPGDPTFGPTKKAVSGAGEKRERYLQGWVGNFDISKYYRPVPGIDDWIPHTHGLDAQNS